MQIQVKLFATLARHGPAVEPGVAFAAEVPAGGTLDDLIGHLELPRDEVRVVFVNGRARSLDWPLHAGDDVGIFPPIGGG